MSQNPNSQSLIKFRETEYRSDETPQKIAGKLPSDVTADKIYNKTKSSYNPFLLKFFQQRVDFRLSPSSSDRSYRIIRSQYFSPGWLSLLYLPFALILTILTLYGTSIIGSNPLYNAIFWLSIFSTWSILVVALYGNFQRADEEFSIVEDRNGPAGTHFLIFMLVVSVHILLSRVIHINPLHIQQVNLILMYILIFGMYSNKFWKVFSCYYKYNPKNIDTDSTNFLFYVMSICGVAFPLFARANFNAILPVLSTVPSTYALWLLPLITMVGAAQVLPLMTLDNVTKTEKNAKRNIDSNEVGGNIGITILFSIGVLTVSSYYLISIALDLTKMAGLYTSPLTYILVCLFGLVCGAYPIYFVCSGGYQLLNLLRNIIKVRLFSTPAEGLPYQPSADVRVVDAPATALTAHFKGEPTIILSTGLFEELSDLENEVIESADEALAAIIAHEEGHIHNGDVFVSKKLNNIALLTFSPRNMLYKKYDFRQREFDADQHAQLNTSAEAIEQAIDAMEHMDAKRKWNLPSGGGLGFGSSDQAFSTIIASFELFYGSFNINAHADAYIRRQQLRNSPSDSND